MKKTASRADRRPPPVARASSLRSGVFSGGGFVVLLPPFCGWLLSAAAAFVRLRVRVVFLLRVFRLLPMLDEVSSSASPSLCWSPAPFQSADQRGDLPFSPAPGFQAHGFRKSFGASPLFPRLPCRDDGKNLTLYTASRGPHPHITVSHNVGQLVQHGDIA